MNPATWCSLENKCSLSTTNGSWCYVLVIGKGFWALVWFYSRAVVWLQVFSFPSVSQFSHLWNYVANLGTNMSGHLDSNLGSSITGTCKPWARATTLTSNVLISKGRNNSLYFLRLLPETEYKILGDAKNSAIKINNILIPIKKNQNRCKKFMMNKISTFSIRILSVTLLCQVVLESKAKSKRIHWDQAYKVLSTKPST